MVADVLSRFVGTGGRSSGGVAWAEGLTIIIPDRDAPQMLEEALASLAVALAAIDEPVQIIVVANGAPRENYAAVGARFPAVEFVHSTEPLGFAGAIERGLAIARFDGTFLLNNDMTLAPDALALLLPLRAADVFAIASQIFQQDATGRREETGFTDWYVDRSGVHLFHANVHQHDVVRPHLCASGGAALFRTRALQRYLPASRCYDPFYWEDADWGVRAWRDGLRVLFAPASHATHRHRATTKRFYAADEIERIVERNRWLFDARHGITTNGSAWLMERLCELPYASQRELSRLRHAAQVFRGRLARRCAQPTPAPVLASPSHPSLALRPESYSYQLRQALPRTKIRSRLLLVTPFAIFPPRHGGARRIAELVAGLQLHFDIVLISDEASLYNAHSFAYFNDLYALHLVQRDGAAEINSEPDLQQRMRSHVHPALVATVKAAIARYRPAIVQIEYAELAGMVTSRSPDTRWVLGLHDVYDRTDFADDAAARSFSATLDAYDAVTVCSDEDRRMVAHKRVICIPNGSRPSGKPYVPSSLLQILFVGPFRYAPNCTGIKHFLAEAWPAIIAAVPAASLLVLGGDEIDNFTTDAPLFAQPGVAVMGHRDDVSTLLAASAMTINPLTGIRGSAVKVIESLAAGRVCVSTQDGARGLADSTCPALVVVPDVAAMAAPVIALLSNSAMRHRLEAPSTALAQFRWERSIDLQRSLYDALLQSVSGA